MTFPIRLGDRALTGAVVDSLDGLRSLRDRWKRLCIHSAASSGFTTWEWLYTWAERFVRDDRRLFVVLVADGDELLGIAPWYTNSVKHGFLRVREVGFLGWPDGGSDYLDVIALKGREALVARSLLALLDGELKSHWDTLRLTDIPSESAFLVHFIQELRRQGKHYLATEGAFCPQVQLPANLDAYLRSMSGHGRQAYRRKTRALRALGDVEHVILRDESAVRAALPELRALYEKRWGSSAGELFDFLLDYLPRARDAWAVEVSLLRVGGQTVAGLVHLVQGRTMYQYLMAVDRTFRPALSIGNLICSMNIENAIEGGFGTYDFLKGEEPYKFQFMNCSSRSMTLALHNRTGRSLAAWTADTVSELGRILLR